MRRMPAGAVLAVPNENNKVYCGQFVADSIVINNVEPDYYAVKLTQTDGDHICYSIMDFDFKYESTYGSIYGPMFYDFNTDVTFCLKGEYSGNSKTLTFVLMDAQGNTIQSPTSFHIDIYRIND